MIKCKHCKVEKLESDMSVWAGKPSKVCIECKKDHPTGRGAKRADSNGGGTARKKSSAAVSRRKSNAAAALELEVPGGGHGFKASVTDEDILLITQENPDAKADNIVLTRAEARQIFKTFEEWAAES